MSKIKSVDDCKSYDEFEKVVLKNGGYIDRQNGSHVIVKSPSGGTCVMPRDRDLPIGTRRSIAKMLRNIGLAIFVLILFISALPYWG